MASASSRTFDAMSRRRQPAASSSRSSPVRAPPAASAAHSSVPPPSDPVGRWQTAPACLTWAPARAFRKALEADPFVDDLSRQTQLAGNLCNRHTCIIHGPNLGECCQQERTPRYVGQLSRLALRADSITRLHTIGSEKATRIGAVATDRTLQPAQLALNG